MGVAADDWARVMGEAERIAGFGVWEWDIPSGRVQWSDALHGIYGLEPGEFAGTVDGFVSHLHPDDRGRVWANISRAVDALEAFAFEERIVRSDGEERVLLSQGHVIADSAGCATTLIGVCHDVTERVEAARALGHSERRMRAIIDNTPSIVAVKDLDGRYVMANAESGSVVGMHPDQLVGSKCVDLFPAELAQQLLAADRRAAAEGEPVYDEATLFRDGDARTYVTVTFPLPDSNGHPIETCTIGTDVTERRERESERRERIEWAGRISSALSERRMLAFSQPIFDLTTGAEFSSELLVRMRADDGAASCSPRRSCPRPSASGSSRPSTSGWSDARWPAPRATRQVNLSAVTLCDPAARKDIVELLAAAPDAARKLVFEITETAAVTHLEAASEFAADVTALGCGLALDDFGTGFGSFTYLRMLPLSYLKIDVSFVRSLLDSNDDRRIVQSIIGIAERFGLRTIAEGVEDGDAQAPARTRCRLRPGLPPRPPSPTRAVASPAAQRRPLPLGSRPSRYGRSRSGPYYGRRRMCGACGSGVALRSKRASGWEGGGVPAQGGQHRTDRGDTPTRRHGNGCRAVRRASPLRLNLALPPRSGRPAHTGRSDDLPRTPTRRRRMPARPARRPGRPWGSRRRTRCHRPPAGELLYGAGYDRCLAGRLAGSACGLSHCRRYDYAGANRTGRECHDELPRGAPPVFATVLHG